MISLNKKIAEVLDNIATSCHSAVNGDGLTPPVATGFKTGFASIDSVSCGFQRGEIILLSAPKAMGKTAFALSVVNMNPDARIAYFSTHLSASQLTKRLMMNFSGLSLYDIQSAQINSDTTQAIKKFFENSRTFICDTYHISVEDMEIEIMQLDDLVDLIIVDNLNMLEYFLLTPVDEKLIKLKNLSKRFDVPVLVLYQKPLPERQMEMTEGIYLTYMQSGLNYDAVDVKCFLYRPEYFRITMDEHGNSLLKKAYFFPGLDSGNNRICLRYEGLSARFSE